MLELIAIILVCRTTRDNARLRGRNRKWAAGYTILIWFTMEVLGAITGTVLLLVLGVFEDMYYLAVIFALSYATVGAYIAILISKIHPIINTAKQKAISVETENKLQDIYSNINSSRPK